MVTLADDAINVRQIEMDVLLSTEKKQTEKATRQLKGQCHGTKPNRVDED